MNTDFILLFVSFLTFVSLLSSLVYVVGIVWRVEMELDTSFKFFASAVLFLILSEGFAFLPMTAIGMWGQLIVPIMKFLAALNLLFGLYFMRDLVRQMDGEVRLHGAKQ